MATDSSSSDARIANEIGVRLDHPLFFGHLKASNPRAEGSMGKRQRFTAESKCKAIRLLKTSGAAAGSIHSGPALAATEVTHVVMWEIAYADCPITAATRIASSSARHAASSTSQFAARPARWSESGRGGPSGQHTARCSQTCEIGAQVHLSRSVGVLLSWDHVRSAPTNPMLSKARFV